MIWRLMNQDIRHDWSFEEIHTLYQSPLLELIYKAGTLLRRYHKPSEIQVCSLISIKTGGCPEDCKYCSQSSRYKTFIEPTPLMPLEEVLGMADQAIRQGASRICLGAAWREVRDGKQFDNVLEIVRCLAQKGVEVCCCLGMLKEHQIRKLAEAGLYAYNHNLDTSRDYYSTIITTRTFDDRVRTLDLVEKAEVSVCCGGIIGLGESNEDRVSLIHTLATRCPHPDSVPINALGAIQGTPLENQPKVSVWDMVKMIAIARITMPKAMVRISAGRLDMTHEQQALCFLAGANSIFSGPKLLTIGNPGFDDDQALFELLGLHRKGQNT